VKKDLRDFFIPHEGNEYRPHSLREESVLYLGTAAVLLFAGALLNTYILLNTSILATIVPSVLVDYVNEDRGSASFEKLEWNQTLTRAAQEKANDMAAKGYFAHTSPEGVTPWSWFKKAGYAYQYAGENLAVYFSDSLDVHTAWMNSPAHRANILNGKFSEIGIATAKGSYQGNEAVFVVELFGRPRGIPIAIREEKPIAQEVLSPTSTVLSGTEEVQHPTNEVPSEKEEGELFVAVRDVGGSGEEENIQSRFIPEYSTIAERTFTSPRSNLYLSYLVLFGIIACALFISVVAEFRRHHPLHTIYGVSLLFFLCALYIGATFTIFSNVSIV
jgi:hypothetical protein